MNPLHGLCAILAFMKIQQRGDGVKEEILIDVKQNSCAGDGRANAAAGDDLERLTSSK